MAVSSYRFISIYIIMGILVGMVTAMYQDTTIATKGYDLNEGTKVQNTGENTYDLIQQSDQLVKSSDNTFNTGWGNENAFERSWVEIFTNAILPNGFIPGNYDASETEKALNLMIKYLRWIIAIFTGFEIFQLILNRKTT